MKPSRRTLTRLITMLACFCATNVVLADELEVPIGASPVMSSVGIFIASEKGYFKEQGIKPVINPFKASGAKMIPFLASGQLFVGGGNVSAGMYNAIANDIPIRIVADKGTVTKNHGYLALLVRKDHVDSGRYKSYKDLKGFKMATTAKGVSQEIATEKYLKSAGLSLDDIELVHLAYADMNIALANKSIDATVQIEPFVSAAVDNGFAARVAGDDEVYPDQQSAVIMFSPVFIDKHPEQAKGFMIAYVKGLRDYNDAFEKGKNKDEIINILTKYTRIKERSVYEKVVPVGLHPDAMLNVSGLRDDATWFVKRGYVKTMPDLDRIVDLSFVENAKKVLGEYK